MQRYITSCLVFIAILASMTHGVHALTIFDEAVLGDFSNSGLTPTLLPFSPGVNLVRTTTGPSSNGDRDDYFQIDLSGMSLQSIVVQAYTPGPGNISTLLENCDQLANTCNQTGTGGQVTVTIGDIGTDVMPGLMQAIGLTDFFRIGENRGPASMELAFTTTLPPAPVPEPGTWLLLGTGLAGCFCYNWRRRQESTPA